MAVMRKLVSGVIAGLVLSCCGTPGRAEVCPNGAEVADGAKCQYFYVFKGDGDSTAVDPRIRDALRGDGDNPVRSLALIVGISEYPNSPGMNLAAARKDVDNLKAFLKDSQQFDEIVVLENQDATEANIRYFLGKYFVRRGIQFDTKSRFLFAYSGHGVKVNG